MNDLTGFAKQNANANGGVRRYEILRALSVLKGRISHLHGKYIGLPRPQGRYIIQLSSLPSTKWPYYALRREGVNSAMIKGGCVRWSPSLISF